jgi:TetR/AcrR family transcriptional regulator, cholesterol catabolism regulator
MTTTGPKQRSLEALRTVIEDAVHSGRLSRGDAEWSLDRLADAPRVPVLRDGNNRKDDVLQAAIKIFRRDGYHRAKLDDVAEEVGLTKATFYHYFTSKTELLEVICDQAMTGAEEAIRRGVEAEGNARDRLRKVAEEYTLALINQASLPVLMRHFDDMETQAQHRLGKRRRDLEKMVIDIVRQGVAEATLHAAHPEIATLTAFGALNWVYVRYSPEGPLSETDVAEVLANQVVRGFL